MNHIILGAKGKIPDTETVINNVKEIGDRYNIELQLVDARLIYGKEHLESAVMHAKRALENKTDLAKSMAVEIILYASGERQISLAISKMV